MYKLQLRLFNLSLVVLHKVNFASSICEINTDCFIAKDLELNYFKTVVQ